MGAHTLTVGQVVEVLSADEIFATLDERGMLDSLPFMPEMARYCGQRLTVGKVANKLCDTMTHYRHAPDGSTRCTSRACAATAPGTTAARPGA